MDDDLTNPVVRAQTASGMLDSIAQGLGAIMVDATMTYDDDEVSALLGAASITAHALGLQLERVADRRAVEALPTDTLLYDRDDEPES